MDKNTSEIAKLTERISQDPKSKLFVPLAEEYVKAGDIKMAVHVLTKGLKNNPEYVSARSLLGTLLLEQADLAGAQREFKEVLKAIPDNRQVLRKLGDLYALQDSPADALKQYKRVLSLSPGDQNTAMLVAEIEAGRDIKQRLGNTKQAEIKPISAPASRTGRSEMSAPDFLMEDDEPEEVLAVEPLEEEVVSSSLAEPDGGLTTDSMVFPTDGGQDISSATQEKARAFSDDNPFAIDDDSPVQAGESQERAESGFEPGEESTEAGKQTDDFTTDTLAELYISQGFFEKAIEIYERMLVDNPNSQGLKDKLANVRAMAAAAAPAAQEQESETVVMDMPPAFMNEPEAPVPSTAETDEFVQSDIGAEQRPLDEWDLAETRAASSPAVEISQPPRKPLQPASFDAEFEPKEYIPPDAVLHDDEIPSNSRVSAGAPAGTSAPLKKTAASSRQATVEKLESWLKNIKKER